MQAEARKRRWRRPRATCAAAHRARVAELTAARRARRELALENAGPAAATTEGAGADDARALTDALSVLQAHHVQELQHALHDGQQASRSTLAFASTAKPAADPMHLQIRRGDENAAVRGGCAHKGRRRERRSEACRASHAGGDALTVLGSLRSRSTAGSKTCAAGPRRRTVDA